MSAEFLTDDYEFAHGRKPRGTGHWAFVPADYAWPGNKMPYGAVEFVWNSYSEAKREVAKKWPSVPAWRVLS